MEIVLIVGPSGVGKSSAIELVKRQFEHMIFHSLDDLAASFGAEEGLIDAACVQKLRRHFGNDDRFLQYGLKAIGALATKNPDKRIVIDVGAGFQVARAASNLHCTYRVIAISSTPEEAYRRICAGRCEKRTMEQYVADEFNRNRKNVYESAHETIDTPLTEQKRRLPTRWLSCYGRFGNSIYPESLTAPVIGRVQVATSRRFS